MLLTWASTWCPPRCLMVLPLSIAPWPTVPICRSCARRRGIPGLPIICEGRVHTPEEARAAIDAGAWAVVVGTAITHPTSITSWFKAALEA